MREKIVLGVVIKMEIRGIGDRGDRFFRAGQEVPSGRSLGPAEVIQRSLLFRRRHLRSVAIVKTHKKHFIIAPWIERQHPQRADHALLQLRAQHRTSVVHEGQQHRLVLMEILSKLHTLAVFVGESGIERHLRIQLWTEIHVLQNGRQTRCGLSGVIRHRLRKATRARDKQGSENKNRAQLLHNPYGFFSSWAGVGFEPVLPLEAVAPDDGVPPFSAMIFMASLTGIFAIPLLLSTQPSDSFAAVSAAILSRKSCCGSALWPGTPCKRGSGGNDMVSRSPVLICARTGAIGVSFSAAMPVKNFRTGMQINSAMTMVSPR